MQTNHNFPFFVVVLHIYPIDSYLATDFVSYQLILLISSWKTSYRKS
jgi:hypothetical protein